MTIGLFTVLSSLKHLVFVFDFDFLSNSLAFVSSTHSIFKVLKDSLDIDPLKQKIQPSVKTFDVGEWEGKDRFETFDFIS